jgi:hypothetical protein
VCLRAIGQCCVGNLALSVPEATHSINTQPTICMLRSIRELLASEFDSLNWRLFFTAKSSFDFAKVGGLK